MKASKERSVTILGSTGSVGKQALDAAEYLNIRVDGISANQSIEELEKQIRAFKPRFCAVTSEDKAKSLKTMVADTDTKVLGGEDAVIQMISKTDATTVLNAISGTNGLAPSLAILENKKNLALANKETLVTGGSLVMDLAKENKVSILPVDSEHCAIHQCLKSGTHQEVNRILLTASGGPFFGLSREELAKKTPADALAHPTWNMGRKITIDSATLANKGLEVIEAMWLFDLSPEKIEVVIHRESIIHSMVEFCDHAVIAQLSLPDMRFCAQYAMTYPDRCQGVMDRLDFARFHKLTFSEPDRKTFLLLDLAYRAAQERGILPAVFNAANEKAVDLFLEYKIGFTEIFDVVSEVLKSCKNMQKKVTVSDIIQAIQWAHARVESLVG